MWVLLHHYQAQVKWNSVLEIESWKNRQTNCQMCLKELWVIALETVCTSDNQDFGATSCDNWMNCKKVYTVCNIEYLLYLCKYWENIKIFSLPMNIFWASSNSRNTNLVQIQKPFPWQLGFLIKIQRTRFPPLKINTNMFKHTIFIPDLCRTKNKYLIQEDSLFIYVKM